MPLLVVVALWAALAKPAWAVTIDGAVVAHTKDAEATRDMAQRILAGAAGAADEAPVLELTRLKGKADLLCEPEELEQILTKELLRLVDAVLISIDGQQVCALAADAEAQRVLSQLCCAFPGDEGSQVKNQYIKEEIEIVAQPVPSGAVLRTDDAVELLLRGTNERHDYEVVYGDNLWLIARDHDMYVDDIKAANPGLSENLQIGQIISLVIPCPYVTVVSEEEKTVQEAIPFETKTISDSSLYTYERKVQTAGEPGQKLTTYSLVRENGAITAQTVIAEQIESEPTTQVMRVGTKQPVYVGTGSYTWPVSRGQVSSRYGPRGGGFHSGVDIVAPQGTPVISADSGGVTFAGWNGAYGKCVIVSHGGSSTLYGHLSQIGVDVGQKVEKGQTIGLVGSTGRSTGAHLHFEIREGGCTTNPLQYFQHQ